MIPKIARVHQMAKELGYEFGKNPCPRWGLSSDSSEFVEFDKYQIVYKKRVGDIKGTSTVKFDTLDEVLDYLKEKKVGRIMRRKK